MFKDWINAQEGNLLDYSKASLLSGFISTIVTNPFWII